MERILLLLWMGLLVENGWKDVYSFNKIHKELDLTRQDAVEKFFAAEKPEYVFLAAAKVGGIVANQNGLH